MAAATSAELRDRVTYVLPLKAAEPATDADLTSYLGWLAGLVEVIVVDGSAPEVFAQHHSAWGHLVRHLPVVSRTRNGKVAGVIDGFVAASTPFVIVADDDVRYDAASLSALVAKLGNASVVVPQNYFTPLPWHARWDSARMLVNRAVGHDYAGTAAVRRQTLLHADGYCGAVLFENLEMLRTLRSRLATVVHADDVFVARRPPSFRHFLQQRVRQAYDSRAQPARQALELSGLPLIVWGATRSRGLLVALALGAVLGAEVGRRRSGGTAVFDGQLSWWAPCWVLERSVCSWLAVAVAARGGARYAGSRLAVAAHSPQQLAAGGCPQRHCVCETQLRRRDQVLAA